MCRLLPHRAILALLFCSLLLPGLAFAQEAIDIGSRRELFVDTFLVDTMKGAKLKPNHPTVDALTSKSHPFCHYQSIIKDGDLYRIYGRGYLVAGAIWKNVGNEAGTLNEVTKVWESRDGLNWTAPELNLYKVDKIDQRLLDFAKKKNVPVEGGAANVVLAGEYGVSHNFTPFIDTRPGVPADERYKALGGKHYQRGKGKERAAKYGPDGLRGYVSADGLRWKRIQENPVIPGSYGAFDSQNVAFWSEAEAQYVCYLRHFKNRVRAIRRTTFKDFLTWTKPVDMNANFPGEHLYTNGTKPYFRAPHIYIALPTRFQLRYHSTTDIMLMTSRNGTRYDRPFKTSYIRPGPELGWYGKDDHIRTFNDRNNYIAYHVVQIDERRMAIYLRDGRRYPLPLDRFASVHAPYAGGEMTTKPLTFKGSQLELNFDTAAAGGVQVEIQDAAGQPIPDYALADCAEIVGDEIARVVTWKGGADVSKLAGKAVRLRLVMKDADVYSLKFKD